MIDGLIVSNGLAWSANGRTMFHSDFKGQRICAYDYDPETGDIANRRVIAQPSAGISAGALSRWTPGGKLDGQIPLPCVAPTMPCFGGPDMKTIFVTSLPPPRSGAATGRSTT